MGGIIQGAKLGLGGLFPREFFFIFLNYSIVGMFSPSFADIATRDILS